MDDHCNIKLCFPLVLDITFSPCWHYYSHFCLLLFCYLPKFSCFNHLKKPTNFLLQPRNQKGVRGSRYFFLQCFLTQTRSRTSFRERLPSSIQDVRANGAKSTAASSSFILKSWLAAQSASLHSGVVSTKEKMIPKRAHIGACRRPKRGGMYQFSKRSILNSSPSGLLANFTVTFSHFAHSFCGNKRWSGNYFQKPKKSLSFNGMTRNLRTQIFFFYSSSFRRCFGNRK